MSPVRQLDDRLLLAINGLARQTPWLHTPLLGYAKYGIVALILVLLLTVVSARHADTRRVAATAWACLAPLIALALNQPIGNLVEEARPYVTHPQILRLADVTTDFSFPSDHAVMGGALAVALLLAHRRLGLTAAALAVLLAFARVYVGAHYPWDVLAGLALGAVVAMAGWWAVSRPLVGLTGWLRRRPGVRQVFAEREDAGRLVGRSEPPDAWT